MTLGFLAQFFYLGLLTSTLGGDGSLYYAEESTIIRIAHGATVSTILQARRNGSERRGWIGHQYHMTTKVRY